MACLLQQESDGDGWTGVSGGTPELPAPRIAIWPREAFFAATERCDEWSTHIVRLFTAGF